MSKITDFNSIDSKDISNIDYDNIGYKVIDREQQIDDLCMWIGEAQSDSDKYLMKEDLKYLTGVQEEYLFSSISTNEYITQSDDEKEYQEICKKYLELVE